MSRTPRGIGAHRRDMPVAQLSFRQPCPSQAVRKGGEILRAAEGEPLLEIGEAERRIEAAQMGHRLPSFVGSAGESLACGEEADHEQEGRQFPEGLLRP